MCFLVIIHSGNYAQQFDGIGRNLKMSLTYTYDEQVQGPIGQNQIPTSETKVFLNTLDMNFCISSEETTASYHTSVTFNQGAV